MKYNLDLVAVADGRSDDSGVENQQTLMERGILVITQEQAVPRVGESHQKLRGHSLLLMEHLI
jgi:hypothetical protein